MVNTEEIQHPHWGRCVSITNGVVEVVATLDVGPRIIRFGAVGGPNEFYESTEPEINDPIEPQFEVFGAEGNWHIRGGHRLWVAPEAMPRTYYPDNKPVQYQIIENGVRLTPPLQLWTQMQMEMDVTMNENGEVDVMHRVTNRSAWPVECAPWAVTVMKVGGLQAVPQSKKDAGLLNNRTLSLWTYSHMADSRVTWGTEYITVRPCAQADGPFKFGLHSEHGYAAYFNHNNLFVKRYSPVENGNYPDGGVSYETYTDANVCEMETLGVLQTLQPGQTAEHAEKWQLILNVPQPKTDDELKDVIQTYVL